MSDADMWPSFASELGRKAIAEVDKWMRAYEAGKISRREYFIAIGTIYDTTSGLAPRDISDLIANIHEDIRNEARNA